MDNDNLDRFMTIALDQAKASLQEGNNGFGAVIVKERTIIAIAHDQEESESDPTSHAELNAIRLASQHVGRHLAGCILVATHEPCPMCAAAMLWAGIRELAFGFSIREAIDQGRNRINCSCQELFEKAGAAVTVHAGVMHADCSLLYREDVRKEIKRLRGASRDDLERLSQELADKRLRWYEANQRRLTIDTSHLPTAGYELLLEKLGIATEAAPVVQKTEKQVVFHSQNLCPTLEACKLLDLDTRQVCKIMTEKPAAALVKQLDGRLEFTRNYDKLRPYGEYCEEIISVSD